MLKRLEAPDLPSELLPGPQVVERDGERTVHQPEKIGGIREDRLFECVASVPGERLGGSIVECQRAAVPAVLSWLHLEVESRRIPLDQRKSTGHGHQECAGTGCDGARKSSARSICHHAASSHRQAQGCPIALATPAI